MQHEHAFLLFLLWFQVFAFSFLYVSETSLLKQEISNKGEAKKKKTLMIFHTSMLVFIPNVISAIRPHICVVKTHVQEDIK